jgi:hypothetical protein
MNRAFTISFDFEGRTYLAMACIRSSSEENFYTVHVYDDSLTRIVPEKNFSYSSKKPLCPLSLRHPNALKLFSCINDALTHHLEVSRSVHH